MRIGNQTCKTISFSKKSNLVMESLHFINIWLFPLEILTTNSKKNKNIGTHFTNYTRLGFELYLGQECSYCNFKTRCVGIKSNPKILPNGNNFPAQEEMALALVTHMYLTFLVITPKEWIFLCSVWGSNLYLHRACWEQDNCKVGYKYKPICNLCSGNMEAAMQVHGN